MVDAIYDAGRATLPRWSIDPRQLGGVVMARTNPYFIAFLEAPATGPEQSLAGYARAFFRSHPDPTRNVDVDAVAGIERLRAAKLSFVDRESRLKALPADMPARLMTQESSLLQSLGKQWPMPPGETMIDARVEVLAQAFGDCPSGAIAVVRQTDKAKIAWLFPRIRVDARTGAMTEQPEAAAPALERPAVRVEALAQEGGGASSPGEIAYETAKELTFLLPEPWGELLKIGMNFFEQLLPEQESHLIEDIVKALETYMKQKDMNNWVQGARSLTKWCDEQLSAMKKVEPTPLQIRNTFLPDLEKNLAPGGESLYDHLMLIAGKDYITEKDALEMLCTCVSSYLFAVKFKLILKAYLAHKAVAENDMKGFNEWNQQWRYDYVLFKDQIIGEKGWSPKVRKIINDFTNQRIGKVTQVERKTLTDFGQAGGYVVMAHGWAFGDTAKGSDDWKAHYYPDEQTWTTVIDHRGDAEANREAYVNQLNDTLNGIYEKSWNTALEWADRIAEWEDHLPPDKPKSAPKIDPAGWQGTAAPGSDWSKHKRVVYAVQFDSANGPGLMSDWSESADIDGRAGPTLSEVPTDDAKTATGRRIFRKLDSNPEQLIGTIPGNKTKTYVDKSA